MKKIAAFVMIIVVAVICSFALVACGGTDNPAPADVAKLVMNKRYIRENAVRDDTEIQVFYVFHADGAGEFTYHHDFSSTSLQSHEHYIIHFKYTYVDGDKSAVVCFFDSIEKLDGDDGSYTGKAWSSIVTVSKNVLATVGTSYTFWINEDYLKTIPHFREKQA